MISHPSFSMPPFSETFPVIFSCLEMNPLTKVLLLDFLFFCLEREVPLYYPNCIVLMYSWLFSSLLTQSEMLSDLQYYNSTTVLFLLTFTTGKGHYNELLFFGLMFRAKLSPERYIYVYVLARIDIPGGWGSGEECTQCYTVTARMIHVKHGSMGNRIFFMICLLHLGT